MAVQAMNGERQARIQATSRPQLGRSISRAAVTAAALLFAALAALPACQPALGVEDFPVADLTVNGRRLETDVPSIIVDGQIMVSIEAVDVALKTTSTRDPATGAVNIVRSELNTLLGELDGLKAQFEAIDQALAASGSLLSLSGGVVMDNPYALACCNGSEADTLQAGLQTGGLIGGTVRIIVSNLDKYGSSISNRDSVFLINADYDPLHSIRDWPEWASNILPFTYEELSAYEPPFVWVRQDAARKRRAVIVVNGAGNVKPAVRLLMSGMVPLDMPVSPVVEVSAIAAQPSAKPAAEIVTVCDDHFEVEVFDKTYADDGSKVLAWVNEAVSTLETVFPDAFDRVPFVKIQLLQPSEQLPHGRVVADPQANPPSIRMIAPTLAEQTDSFYDRDYHVGNLAHEFMHCLHERYSVQSTGKSLYDREMPKWFTEGVAEYARFLVLGEKRFHERESKIYDSAAKEIIDKGLDLVNYYSGGAWAFRYMHHVYGTERIVALLKSKELLFKDALKAELGVTMGEFESGLKKWLADR